MSNLTDANIEHQIALTRYINGRASVAVKMVDPIGALIKRLLNDVETDRFSSMKELDDIIKQVRTEMNKQFNDITATMQTDISDVMRNESEFQATTINGVTGVKPVVPPISAIRKSVNARGVLTGSKQSRISFDDMVSGWHSTEKDRVIGSIVSGFYQGLTVNQISKNVVGLKSHQYKDGLLNMTRSNIRGLVKTSLSQVSSSAKAEFANKNTDIIIGMKDVATLDSDTSMQCKSRDQTIYLFKTYGANYPQPSYHFNCRTIQTPVLSPEYDNLETAGVRPSVADGEAKQVSDKMSYYQWLEKQNKAVQVDSLGAERAAIFRNAGLTAAEFKKAATDQFFNPLTIEQMAAKDKRIADYLRKSAQ